MLRFAAAAALLCLTFGAPAWAEEVSLRAGEGLLARFDSNGGFVVVERRAARNASDLEGDLAAALTGNPAAMGENAMPVIGATDHLPVVVANHIVIDMIALPTGHTLLVIGNGYAAQDTSYRANLESGDVTSPTDVCTVLAGRFSVEHWPYPLTRLDLSDIRLIPAQPAPTCR